MFVNLIPSLTLGPVFVQNWGLKGGNARRLKSLLWPHYTPHLTPVRQEKGQDGSQPWPPRLCPFSTQGCMWRARGHSLGMWAPGPCNPGVGLFFNLNSQSIQCVPGNPRTPHPGCKCFKRYVRICMTQSVPRVLHPGSVVSYDILSVASSLEVKRHEFNPASLCGCCVSLLQTLNLSGLHILIHIRGMSVATLCYFEA